MMFSLILPVYGVEKYIERCLTSCCCQKNISTKDYEIIVVDDSSPDNSVQIAKRVFESYPEISHKIVSRPNGGLSAARNTGFEVAKGNYIWFIDSDDYIEENALAILLNIVVKYPDLQVVTFGHRNIYPNRSVECPTPEPLFDSISSGIDLVKCTSFYSACNRIYKREHITLNGIRFKEGILWEDGEFNLRLLSVTSKHYCCPAIMYNYVRRPNSISTANKITRTLNSDLYKFDSLSNWISDHFFSENDVRILNQRNNESIIFMLAGLHHLPRKDRERYYTEITKRKRRIRDSFKNSAKLSHRFVGFIILLFPRVASRVLGWKMDKLLSKEKELLE